MESYKVFKIVNWTCPVCSTGNRAGRDLGDLNGIFTCKCCDNRFVSRWTNETHTLIQMDKNEVEQVWSIFNIQVPGGATKNKPWFFINKGYRDLETGVIKYVDNLDEILSVKDYPGYFLGNHVKLLETVSIKELIKAYDIRYRELLDDIYWILNYHFREYIGNGRNAANVMDLIWAEQFKKRNMRFKD